MNRVEKLRAIIAHCEGRLEMAKKRTPGEWRKQVPACDHDDPEHTAIRGGGCLVSVCVEKPADAAFIAACAGDAERGWRSTIEACYICITQLGYTSCPSFVEIGADCIIEQWEDAGIW